mmetsp:Transcript_43928/g.99270  ORF Transcript_43928/g.99270 Transcript_43928/m.99270 type:complete len:135 (-) Transcript_43928:320-724(-)|eukprot:CAMPEP_0172581966 /NCGR_PEP_ID=MMETSP1068-20121228/1365_1 /TAXON_ID=35684 /ORGANISM="Pseudopedinella elastica, Strain CCMP716" /LENGTH=134 /DNA_ID=CAMNT_0013375137 /DNA_START=80 /DNA_END=484 /DNA_ORIENTATION=+
MHITLLVATLLSALACDAFAPGFKANASRSPKTRVGAAPAEIAQESISSAEIMVFSKSTCPFCKKTKDLFDSLEVEYTVMELNERSDGPAIQDALAQMTGQRTVPNVFIKGKHLGGNDDTQKANRDGTLLKMLE